MKPTILNVLLTIIGWLGGILFLAVIVCVIIEYPIIKERQRRNKEEWERKQAQKKEKKQ